MSKLQILICDDQKADHAMFKKKFIDHTFLADHAEVSSLYFLKKAPSAQLSFLEYIADPGKEIDLIFMDVEFDPEGITEMSDVIQTVMDAVAASNRICQVLLITKQGGDVKDGKYDHDNYSVPFIRKDAKAENINFFLRRHFENWIKAKLFSLDYDGMSSLRDSILGLADTCRINNRVYGIKHFFACYQPSEYYSASTEIPSFKFNGWDEVDKSMKFDYPLRAYYADLYGNLKNYLEYRKWLERTKLFLTAINLSDSAPELPDDDAKRFQQISLNALFVWDTSKLSGHPSEPATINKFIRRIMERNIIIFQYAIAYRSPEEIYKLLGGKLFEPDEHTVGNGFRLSYWLKKTVFSSDLDKRRHSFKFVIDQLPFEDRILLKQTGKILEAELKKYGLKEFDDVLNVKLLDAM